MYEVSEIQDYTQKWLEAERDLAIKSFGILDWFPILQEVPNLGEDTVASITPANQQSCETEGQRSASSDFEDPEDLLDIQAGLKTQELYKKHGRSAFVPLKSYTERRKKRSV